MMFRRMYLTISGLLITSTALLLIVLGVTVYGELETALRTESQNNLVQLVGPVEDNLGDILAQPHSRHPVAPSSTDLLHSGRGDTIFFYAVDGKNIYAMPRRVVPYSVIVGSPTILPGHFPVKIYKGIPYRVYAFTTTMDSRTVYLYSYVSISEEASALRHTRDLMWTVGGVGFVIALICNLFLAQRFLRPTIAAWTAYRETVLELSHELQTPLATVNAMITNRGVQSDTAADIRQELERASQMVSDMLFLSRLRSGVIERATQPVAVSDITEELGERFQAVAKAQGLTLTGSTEAGLFVDTTPGEWERLVSTLFKNVVDHADAEERATWELKSDGKRIRFLVKNFVPKTRATGTPRAPERGVGLQIVSRLVRKMRGKLDVVQKNRTFVVTVTLPAKRRRW